MFICQCGNVKFVEQSICILLFFIFNRPSISCFNHTLSMIAGVISCSSIPALCMVLVGSIEQLPNYPNSLPIYPCLGGAGTVSETWLGFHVY